MFTLFKCEKNSDSTYSSIPYVSSELNFLFENPPHDVKPSHIIDGRIYHTSVILLEGDVLFSIARRAWRQLEAAVFDEIDVVNVDVTCVRQQVVDLLILCRYSVRSNPNFLINDLTSYVNTFTLAVTKWADLDRAFLSKLSSARTLYNEQLIYHYFHMYLEINWLIMTLNRFCSSKLSTLEDLMCDIVQLQYLFYKKQKEELVRDIKAFVCPCVKHLLLLVTIYCEKTDRNFWELFNNCSKDMDDGFSLWFLSNVAQLQGYNEEGVYIGPGCERIKENHKFLEKKLKMFVIGYDHELLDCLKLVNVTLNEWWLQSPKLDAYQILWEIIYKHINNFAGLPSKTASDIIDFIDTVAYDGTTTNSYQYFLYMLIGFLSRFPNHWSKIRGRIYSKLSPHKINDFSNTGILNIACLYMSLMRENIQEMSDKLLPLLENLRTDRRNTELVINIHMAVLILHVRQGFSIQVISTSLLGIIHDTVEQRDKFHLVRVYIEGFSTVLRLSRSYNLQQNVLIGKWVSRYVSYCEFSDLCYFLDVLLSTVKRIRNAGAWNDWKQVFDEHVLLSLKSIAASSSAPLQVGELAALIDLNPLSQHVITFTADNVIPKVACQFTTTILDNIPDNYELPKTHETAIFHAWTRCCLLNCENIETLTKNVTKLSALALVFNTPSANNPLCSFIKCVGKSAARNRQELLEQCFGGMDAWLTPHLKSPSNESQSVHIYTCMALVFFHCSPLLYQKQRTDCLLSRLIGLLLLPTETLLGKQPHPFTLNALQYTWHLFLEGIYLLQTGDAFVERTLRDLVVRYIPLFQISNTPILKCLHNEKLSCMIFNKVGGMLSSQTSRTDSNTTKALKVLRVVLKSASPAITAIVLDNCLTPILEVVMFHNDKSDALEIIKTIHSNYKEHLKKSINVVTEKHLAFNSNNYFQFASMLAKIVPQEICEVLPSIKKQVVEVERRRGVGYDNTLRQAFERLVALTN